ncbi:MAG TPA: YkgJ family cysteine cluster protein [Tepidisphaeraceae bacterium]|nr:YkgJ family cysteine cluster protein [Tepidisphaeraceae bacterium]
MRLQVLKGENFSCHSCTTCCRDWHVELSADEVERIKSLNWPGDDSPRNITPFLRHGGKTFIAHQPDGACIFLNSTNGRCRIHEQFGASAKPLGCRLFPFHVSPTFNGEVSILGRCDCPSIRRNQGEPVANQIATIRQLVNEMDLPDEPDEAIRCYLDREQIEAVTEFIGTMLNGFGGDRERALFIFFLCEWLATVGADELDREVLAGSFAQVRQRVMQAVLSKQKKPGLFGRLAFRMLLGTYLRRDEDVLNGRAGRLGRMLSLMAIVMGFGSFRGLGLSHPRGKLKRAGLFKSGVGNSEPSTFSVFWRVIRNRLDTFQFMGNANSGRNFIEGLRSLALLYPLVLATAKYGAANRGSAQIGAEDVDYAIGAIDHSFGRLAVLNQPQSRSLEKLLLSPDQFVRLVATL